MTTKTKTKKAKTHAQKLQALPRTTITRRRWTDKEIAEVKKKYATTSNLTLAKLLDRTQAAIAALGFDLGLKKTDKFLEKMGRDNVAQRYN